MKKILVVLVVLLLSGLILYACGNSLGGGGKTGTSNTSSGGGGSNPGDGGSNPGTVNGGTTPGAAQPAPNFTLKLVDGDTVNAVRATTFASTVPNPTNVRVIMRRFSGTTETYKDIQDVGYVGGTATVYMPIATGYTIDVITNIESYGTVTTKNPIDAGAIYTLVGNNWSIQIPIYDELGFTGSYNTILVPVADITTVGTITYLSTYPTQTTHKILKFGEATGVNVDQNSTSTTVNIFDVGNRLNMTVVDNVLSSTTTHDQKFDVITNITGAGGRPFAPSYSLSSHRNATEYSLTSCSSNTCTINAPVLYYSTFNSVSVAVDLKGTFTLDSAFAKAGDSTIWTRTFPDLTGEQVWYNVSPLVGVAP